MYKATATVKRQRNTIRSQIARIQRLYKNRDKATRMLYSSRSELRRSMRAVVLYTLFVSDQATFLLQPHIFQVGRSDFGRDAEDWADWFRANYGDILRDFILDGMSNRTEGKTWRVHSILGWHATTKTKRGTDVRSKSRDTKVHSRRHKTKRKGR